MSSTRPSGPATTRPPDTTLEPDATLDAARSGDQGAFERLVQPYRRELHAHCYRMLGSVHDAEDALQDVLLRAWKGLPGFSERSTLRTWLYPTTTHACRAVLHQRPRRAIPVDYGPAEDPLESTWRAVESGWVEPYPAGHAGSNDLPVSPAARYDQLESVELAFVAAFQHLPGTQRAVLILREVMGFSAAEVAELLETSVPSVTSALQRARRTVEDRLPSQSQQANLRAIGDHGLREVVEAYVRAWERGDAHAILALLAEDAVFSMPPYTTWYRGHEAIATFLPLGPLRERWRHVRTHANGQVAFGCYFWHDERACYVGHSVDVLTLRGTEIAQVTAFLDPELLPVLGLPDHLSGDPTD
jgi:RNA polymerase sigma-70 factor, ECF subfamily